MRKNHAIITFHDLPPTTIERRVLTLNENGHIIAEKRRKHVGNRRGTGGSGGGLSRSSRHRIAKQISRRLQFRSKLERSDLAAAPVVGHATATLLTARRPFGRQLLEPPRSPPPPLPPSASSRSEVLPFGRQRIILPIRRAQLHRLPTTLTHPQTLLVIGDLHGRISSTQRQNNHHRLGSIPSPPLEPPRHWNGPTVHLVRPTNIQLTDLRILPRPTSNAVIPAKAEKAEPQSTDLSSDSDIEQAVIKAIIESSTAISRRRHRLRRPGLLTNSLNSKNSMSINVKPSATNEETFDAFSNTETTTRSSSVKPTKLHAVDASLSSSVATPSPPPEVNAQSPFSRRKITSLRARSQSRGLHHHSNIVPNHQFSEVITSPPITISTTPSATTAGRILPISPISPFVGENTVGSVPRLETTTTFIPTSTVMTTTTTIPPTTTTTTTTPPPTTTTTTIPFVVENTRVQPITSLFRAKAIEEEETLRQTANAPSKVFFRKNLIDHSTSNEITEPLRRLPISEVIEGSADLPVDEVASNVPTPPRSTTTTTTFTTAAPTTTHTTMTTTTTGGGPSPNFKPITSLAARELARQANLTNGPVPPASSDNNELKEELNLNAIEEPSRVAPPAPHPHSHPPGFRQETGAPGAAPPSDLVVNELNRADDFMEVARRLRILRSNFPQARLRQRRSTTTKISGDTTHVEDTDLF
ncbi:hypothetical protein Q1695_010059 [Nippostrongylus brasiliensis]|nr:hypothetical protein Q1695_010059 [Nippostrongylus brasiliensis]